MSAAMQTANMGCPTPEPFTVRVGGPQPDEDRTSLVFTPQFPCGVERSIPFLSADDAPLRRISTPRFCVGDPGDPPRHVLVRASVWSLDSTRLIGVVNPLVLSDCDPNVMRSQPRVKIEVLSCAHDQSVIIDSDSSVVVPGGEIGVNILVPGPTLTSIAAGSNLGAWVQGQTTIADSLAWTDVTIRIDACPLDDYVPEGHLTEWIRGMIDTTSSGDRTLIKPRRARRLELSPVDTNTRIPATVQVDWLQDVIGASATMGAFIVATTSITTNLVGAAQAIRFAGVPAAGRDVYVRWGIG